MIVILVRGGLA